MTLSPAGLLAAGSVRRARARLRFVYMDINTKSPDERIPVSPGLVEEEAYLTDLETPPEIAPVDSRTALMAGLAIIVAIGAGLVAQLLTALIAVITNISYYHTVSFSLRSPGGA